MSQGGSRDDQSDGSARQDAAQDVPRWQQIMRRAKRLHRPKHVDWGQGGFATWRAGDFDALQQLPEGAEGTQLKKHAGTLDGMPTEHLTRPHTGVEVVHIDDVDVDEFRNRFERPNLPAIIRGVPEREHWSAHVWTSEDLAVRFPQRLFKVGEDDDGYPVRVPLCEFLTYQRENIDDSPLYIFDSRFGRGGLSKEERKRGKNPLLKEYRKPALFCDDLFSYAGEKRRPPYRWFLVGPKRSGSCVHIDPLGTAAWNTSLRGRKRWVLFPPGTPKHIVKGKSVIRDGEDDEAVNYFCDFLPRMRRRYRNRKIRFVEFIQHEGDTVFVPEGWWHAVLNLDDTLAVTQNFCSPVNLPVAWRKCRVERKKMAMKWLHQLELERPELAQVVRDINTADGFEMEDYFDYKKRRQKQKLEKKLASSKQADSA